MLNDTCASGACASERQTNISECPARRAISLSEKGRKIEFIDRKFLIELGSSSNAQGVLVDGDLYLVHRITRLDCRARHKNQPYASIHLIRTTIGYELLEGVYYYFNPAGYGERLLRIPRSDIKRVFFTETEQRDEVTANLPWEYDSDTFPFWKYQLAIPDLLEA